MPYITQDGTKIIVVADDLIRMPHVKIDPIPHIFVLDAKNGKLLFDMSFGERYVLGALLVHLYRCAYAYMCACN